MVPCRLYFDVCSFIRGWQKGATIFDLSWSQMLRWSEPKDIFKINSSLQSPMWVMTELKGKSRGLFLLLVWCTPCFLSSMCRNLTRYGLSGNYLPNSAISPVRIVPTNHIPFLFIPKPHSYIFGDFPKPYSITVAQEKFRLSLWSIVSGSKRKTIVAGQKTGACSWFSPQNVISKHFWKLNFHLPLPYNRQEYKPSLWHQGHLL